MPTNPRPKGALLASLVLLGGSAGFAVEPSARLSRAGRQETKEEAKGPVLQEHSDDEETGSWRDHLEGLEPEQRQKAIRDSWIEVLESEETGASPLLETPERKEPRGEPARVERKEEVGQGFAPSELAAIDAARRADLDRYLAGASLRRAQAIARIEAERVRRRAERLAMSVLATETPQARAARQAAMAAERAARGLPTTRRSLFE
jgi:hypothetical protein